MMADRTVRVVLQAVTNQFKSALNDAATSARKLREEVKQATATAGGELQQVGGAAAAIGGSMLVAAGAVAKTGIEYNTLQQKSRAALTTILGGAEAANAQMDKLDEFARTSPFAKQTFITAQQQMLAFGIEAEKVVPYLSAINDAVAAAGGNSQMLGEVAFVIAQIGAAGKITAQDLMQLGQRGINAAQLIGDAMGTTGAAIREQITAGTLDANDALDALTTSMSDKFGGASANVKETMEGAFDRVKAAWRDLSASIMEPAVGQQGGGFLVDLTNGVADFLRMIDRLPDGVKQGVTALAGVSGAALTAGGALLILAPQIHATVTAMSALARAMPTLVASAGPAGIAIAGLTTIVTLAATAWNQNRERIDSYKAALADATAESEKQLRADVLQRASKLGLVEVMEDVDVGWATMIDAMLGSESAHDLVIRKFDEQIAAQRAIIDGNDDTQTSYIIANQKLSELMEMKERFVDMSGREAEAAAKAAEEHDRANGVLDVAAETKRRAAADEAMWARHMALSAQAQQEQYEVTLDGITLTDAYVEALEKAGGAVVQFADGTRALTKEQLAAYEAIAQADGSFINLIGAYEEAVAAQEELADASTTTTEQFLANLRRQVEAQTEWRTNMLALAGRVSEGTLQYLAELGPKGAQLVKDMNSMTADELAEVEQTFALSGRQSGMEFTNNLKNAQPVLDAAARFLGQSAMEQIRSELARGDSIQAVIDRWNLEALIDANTDPALRAAEAAMRRINSMSASISVDIRQNITRRVMGQAPLADGGRVGDALAVYGMSDGGRVYGSGTSTSDTAANVALSNDEYVLRAWAARMIGYDQLDTMNATGRIPQAQDMRRTPSQYTVNYSVPQAAPAAPTEVHNHYSIEMPTASLRDVATVAEFFKHADLYAHHAGGSR